MSHLRRFVAPPAGFTEDDLAVVAKHLALDLIEPTEICEHLQITNQELARLQEDPVFAERVRVERRRLGTTLEGQRELADWKQAMTENKFWDRLMTMALNDQTSATSIIDGFKVVKRPVEKAGAGGGYGGPVFAININVPGADATRVTIAPTLASSNVVDAEGPGA